MTRLLFLIVAAAFITSSFAQIHQFLRRASVDNEIVASKCSGDGWKNNLVDRFTGIFFGNFHTGGGEDILGSLAVKGNFRARNYVINSNHGTNCSATEHSYDSYGLVVGGITHASNVQVHGSAYLSGSGTVHEIKELEHGCQVTDQKGTGHFNFENIERILLKTSQQFANSTPTLILEDNNSLTELRKEMENYEILVFHTCRTAKCSPHKNSESVPNHLYWGQGNWNGVSGPITVSRDKTYILNAPVTNGTTFVFSTNNPALNLNPCKVIWNFYPVDDNGNYLPNGEFTLIRRTANQLGGFTLAPRGHIIDGGTGNFAGNIVGLDYTWENLNAGVEIHDYRAAGGNCNDYIGCLPYDGHSSEWKTSESSTSNHESSTTSATTSASSSESIITSHQIITMTSTDCEDTMYTTTTAVERVTSLEMITLTAKSKTTTTVTSVTTESLKKSHIMVSGQKDTLTHTETAKDITTETDTDIEMQTDILSTDLTISTLHTMTLGIVSKSTTSLCAVETTTLYTECDIIEMCSSVTEVCTESCGERYDHNHNTHDKHEEYINECEVDWKKEHEGHDEDCEENNDE